MTTNEELIKEAEEYADAIQGGENENWMRLVTFVYEIAEALKKSDTHLTEALAEVKRLVNLPTATAAPSDTESESSKENNDEHGIPSLAGVVRHGADGPGPVETGLRGVGAGNVHRGRRVRGDSRPSEALEGVQGEEADRGLAAAPSDTDREALIDKLARIYSPGAYWNLTAEYPTESRDMAEAGVTVARCTVEPMVDAILPLLSRTPQPSTVTEAMVSELVNRTEWEYAVHIKTMEPEKMSVVEGGLEDALDVAERSRKLYRHHRGYWIVSRRRKAGPWEPVPVVTPESGEKR